MFTGIVEARGSIRSSTPTDKGARIEIAAGGLDMSDVRIGDSIAVDGCCLTVVEKSALGFLVDASQETLDCTTGFPVGRAVNLEKALRLSDRLGGHLVSGHVDGIGRVTRLQPVGESWALQVDAPRELARFLAYKGSITVNGVSLTVNAVRDHAAGCEVQINLIPHTMTHTAFGSLRAGSAVNLEIDLIARYVERMLVAGVAPVLPTI
jgi:riboflavin synthase